MLGIGNCLALMGVLLVMTNSAETVIATDPDNLAPTARYDYPCSKNSICQTDNSTVTYYFDAAGDDALEGPDRRTARKVVNGMFDDGVDLGTKPQSPMIHSGSHETDWYIREARVSGDATGRAVCDDPLSGTYRCDQFYITVEGGANFRKGPVCHEVAHATGFVHGRYSNPKTPDGSEEMGCSRTPVYPWSSIDLNQIQRINNNY